MPRDSKYYHRLREEDMELRSDRITEVPGQDESHRIIYRFFTFGFHWNSRFYSGTRIAWAAGIVSSDGGYFPVSSVLPTLRELVATLLSVEPK